MKRKKTTTLLAPSSTNEKILESALRELMEKGIAGLTIQGVATRTGISLGNLTYHFRTRDDLVAAMIDHWFEAWKREFFQIIYERLSHTQPNFGRFIDWVMDNALTPDNVRTFTELWAMGNHVPKVARMLDQLYAQAIDTVLKTLGLSPSTKRASELRSLLYVLAAVSEGSTAILGNAPRNHPQRRLIKKRVRSLLEPVFEEAFGRAKVVRG